MEVTAVQELEKGGEKSACNITQEDLDYMSKNEPTYTAKDGTEYYVMGTNIRVITKKVVPWEEIPDEVRVWAKEKGLPTTAEEAEEYTKKRKRMSLLDLLNFFESYYDLKYDGKLLHDTIEYLNNLNGDYSEDFYISVKNVMIKRHSRIDELPSPAVIEEHLEEINSPSSKELKPTGDYRKHESKTETNMGDNNE